jgi:peptidoglycan/xylan/chitin deacetylase (PgdA/CDA1 family)
MKTTIPVLTFHSIDERCDVISVSPQVFQRGITRLHGHGYQSLSLLDAVDIIRCGQSFPERSIVITFDDGYQSVYENAFPFLQRYGMVATVFLTVGIKKDTKLGDHLPSLENRAMLSWDEIREMHRYGIDFGAHTLTHPDLTRLADFQLQSEIYDSKIIIEDALGTRIFSFAYPFGRYNRRARAMVQQHFTCACSARLGLVNVHSDIFTLKRVDAYYLRTDRLFGILLTRFFPWYLNVRNLPRRLRQSLQG